MKATIGALVAIVAGLIASLALANDYLLSPSFCATTGCDVVRASGWSHPFGIPMPVVGIAYFALILVLLAIDRPRLRRAVALAGAAGAIGLVALQGLVIGAWCKLCLVADPAAIVLGGCVLAGAELKRWRIGAMFGTVATAAIAFGVLATTAGAPAPSYVAPRTAEVTIVEMVDFECPYCRAMNERVEAALARTSVRVDVVRKMVPLSMHANAMPAALAWCCADAQGKGHEMANALFAADPAALTADGCAAIAARIGCDMARYREDMAHAHDRVASDMREAKAAGIRGLPTLFIGAERVEGLSMTTEELVAAIERARG